MSSNQGKAVGHMIGLRVATQCGCEDSKRKVVYTPGYTRADGKQIRACCKVTAFINHEKGRGSSVFTLTGWNKLADILAKGMSPGKEFYAQYEIKSYYANVYNNANQQVMHPDGEPLQVMRYNFTITDFLFGEDGQNFIDHEILNTKRPANWNTEEGKGAWRTRLDARNAAVYNPTKATFGFARINKKSGELPAGSTTGVPTEDEVRAAADGASALKNSFGQVDGQAKTFGPDEDPF